MSRRRGWWDRREWKAVSQPRLIAMQGPLPDRSRAGSTRKQVGKQSGEHTAFKQSKATPAGRSIATALMPPRYPIGSDEVLVSAVAEELVEN